jgi:hypothetical protein
MAAEKPRKSVLITGYVAEIRGTVSSADCCRCSLGGIGHALAREFHSKGKLFLKSIAPADTPWSERLDADSVYWQDSMSSLQHGTKMY